MILDELRKELKLNVDREYKKGCENFFKEKIIIYGVRIPVVRKIAKKYFDKNLSKEEIFNLAEELLKNKYNEESTMAFQWVFNIKNKFTKEDFKIFEKWVSKYVDNWAKCDDFCTHSVGYLVFKYPELISSLKKWTRSKNLWIRRGAAVSLIYPIRKEDCLKDVFYVADRLLLDKEDLVQKGYGWMLKVAADFYQREVFDYVMKNKVNMPRTALRYAIEKMPKDLKKKAMKL